MRGQHLFIRPVEPGDAAAIQALFAASAWSGTPPAQGLVGKLVGDLAAVLGMDLEPGIIVVRQIVVKGELRRKRIGRTLLDELERLAAKLERDTIVVQDPLGNEEFLRHVGFGHENGIWLRRVRR